MKKYYYFVSFVAGGDFGNAEVVTHIEIAFKEMIDSAADIIKRTAGVSGRVVVLNYQLMRVEE